MIPKYLMFAVGLVAVTTVALAAMEIAVLSQIQQDADAKSLTGECASSLKNASAAFCHNLRSAAEEEQDTQDDTQDDEEEEEDE